MERSAEGRSAMPCADIGSDDRATSAYGPRNPVGGSTGHRETSAATTVPDDPQGDPDADGAEAPTLPPAPSQTPLFHAIEQARYARQTHVREIEAVTGRRLISYVAGPRTSITAFDIPPFVDLIDDIESGSPIDLLLQTPGGDIDQAERIVLLCRKRAGDADFRVIVPDSAKSAGTLIAVAADEIVMGEPSELGPIDPQVFITTASGEQMGRPANSFLDGLKQIREESADGDLSPAYFPLLDKLDPALIDFCEKAIKRSEKFAREFLEKYMLKGDPGKAREIAARLGDVDEYLSHAATIDAEQADELGLNVRILPHDDRLWQAYWRLYADMRVALSGDPEGRLFEGRKASLRL